jgi:HK97 family phage prohead protease
MENRKTGTAVESAVERRFFRTECRADHFADTGKMVIGGYGAVFNQYTNMGWYAEVIEPGFFDGIKDNRCACLFNHDPNHVLGRKQNNTLTLKTDAAGLEYLATLPSHRTDVYELVRDGYVYESSFAFTTARAEWEEVDRDLLAGLLPDPDLDRLSYGGKISVRRLKQGRELFDVSPVTYGAYEGTSTDTREARKAFEAWKAQTKDEQEIVTKPDRCLRTRLLATLTS